MPNYLRTAHKAKANNWNKAIFSLFSSFFSYIYCLCLLTSRLTQPPNPLYQPIDIYYNWPQNCCLLILVNRPTLSQLFIFYCYFAALNIVCPRFKKRERKKKLIIDMKRTDVIFKKFFDFYPTKLSNISLVSTLVSFFLIHNWFYDYVS